MSFFATGLIRKLRPKAAARWPLHIFLGCGILIPPTMAQESSKGLRVVSPEPEPGNSYFAGSFALLIGCSDYEDPAWRDLPTIPSELQRISTSLKQQGFGVTTVINPDAKQLRETLESFKNKHGFEKGNRLLLLYSGHGYSFQDESGTFEKDGYLVPVDAPSPLASAPAFRGKCVHMASIAAIARELQAKHALFLFDSCFSGSVFHQTRSPLATPPRPALIRTLVANPVRQFISAGTARQEVPAESIFAKVLVRAINGEADFTQDGVVTGTELGTFLEAKVSDITSGRQTPQYDKMRDVDYDSGDFVFFPSALHRPSTPETAIPTLPRLEKREVQRKAETLRGRYEQLVAEGALEIPSLAVDLVHLDQGFNDLLAGLRQDDPASQREAEQLESDLAQLEQSFSRFRPELSLARLKNASVAQPFVNSLGMSFVPLPIDALSGTPSFFSRFETTQAQFQAFLDDSTALRQEREAAHLPDKWRGVPLSPRPEIPIVYVSWTEAVSFCAWLTKREHQLGCLPKSHAYRLPSDREWSIAVGLKDREDAKRSPAELDEKVQGYFSWGGTQWPPPKNAGNFADKSTKTVFPDFPIFTDYHDGHATLAPGGQFDPNLLGLFDLAGNVLEWCLDELKPGQRVLRGGSWWESDRRKLLASYRSSAGPDVRKQDHGFRCCLAPIDR